MKKIIFYETESGKSPVEDFLDSMSSKQAQKAAWVFSLVEELPAVPKKYLKNLVNTDDIWEVRLNYANNIFRFLGFLMVRNLLF